MSLHDILADPTLALKVSARQDPSGHVLNLLFRCGGQTPQEEFDTLPLPEEVRDRIKDALGEGIRKERDLRGGNGPTGQEDGWVYRWAVVSAERPAPAAGVVVGKAESPGRLQPAPAPAPYGAPDPRPAQRHRRPGPTESASQDVSAQARPPTGSPRGWRRMNAAMPGWASCTAITLGATHTPGNCAG